MIEDIDIAPPIDGNEILWRYMDFASFCYLLQTKGLFFRRLDTYSDRHEGTLAEEIQFDIADQWSTQYPWLFRNKESAGEAINKLFVERLKEYNKGTLCCSWTANPVENYAMWKIYLRSGKEGVAIRTTVDRLRAALRDTTTRFTLAKVKYELPVWRQIEYQTLAIYKTKPYSYENELRVIVYDQFEPNSIPEGVFPKIPLHSHGTTFDVNIETLIEQIYVSPFADSWFHDLVRLTVNSHLPTVDPGIICTSKIKDA